MIRAREGRDGNGRVRTVIEPLEGRCLLSGIPLDGTFGSGGRVELGVAGRGDWARSALVLSDGRILVAGGHRDPADDVAHVYALRPDGSLDRTFGQDGRLELRGASEIATMREYDDGSLLLAGQGSPGVHQGGVFVARTSADGVPLWTRRINGTPRLGGASAIATAPDGDILVGGGVQGADTYGDYLVARLNPDGSPEGGFGSGGVVQLHLHPQFGEAVTALATLSDGRILAGGTYDLMRLMPDGSLDQSFGKGGVALSTSDRPRGFSLLPDGRFVMFSQSGLHAALSRYNADGSRDASFDGDGIVFHQTRDATLQDVLVERLDGGYSIVAFGQSAEVARFDADGRLGDVFQSELVTAGEALTIFGGAVQPDGKVLIIGTMFGASTTDPDWFDATQVFVARFEAFPNVPEPGAAAVAVALGGRMLLRRGRRGVARGASVARRERRGDSASVGGDQARVGAER